MTREDFARRIRWPIIIWTAGLVNVTAMLPQLWKIISTRETKDLAVGMFIIYFCLQVCFCLEGFFSRNRMLMWCLGLSAVVTATIIVLVVNFRYFT